MSIEHCQAINHDKYPNKLLMKPIELILHTKTTICTPCGINCRVEMGRESQGDRQAPPPPRLQQRHIHLPPACVCGADINHTPPTRPLLFQMTPPTHYLGGAGRGSPALSSASFSSSPPERHRPFRVALVWPGGVCRRRCEGSRVPATQRFPLCRITLTMCLSHTHAHRHTHAGTHTQARSVITYRVRDDSIGMWPACFQPL